MKEARTRSVRHGLARGTSPPNPGEARDDAATLTRLERSQTEYDRRLWRPAQRGSRGSPAQLCEALLAELFADAADPAREAERFFAWALGQACQAGAPRLAWVLGAQLAAARGDWTSSRDRARTAMSLSQRDTYAQRLFLAAKARVSGTPVPSERDLEGRFCARPFEELELRVDGEVMNCCSAWLPVPIGNFHHDAVDDLWNSDAAAEIRRSVLDGDFRHCSRVHCPEIVGRKLPRRADVRDPFLRRVIDERLVLLPRRPVRVLLSHDRSCNISCPSCRTGTIMARREETERLDELADRVIFPLLADARKVKVTGSGDPFASPHFRYVLERLGRREVPGLRVQIQTNGLLLDEKAWDELHLDGLVESIWVSIDAAREETYAVVRRGGSWKRLLANLAFMGTLRRAGRIDWLRLDFVVQAQNFREMPGAVEIARANGFDGVAFQMIRNWGTWSAAEFAKHDIGSAEHPEFAAFLEVLRAPSLAGGYADLGNVRELVDRARDAIPEAEAPAAAAASGRARAAPVVPAGALVRKRRRR